METTCWIKMLKNEWMNRSREQNWKLPKDHLCCVCNIWIPDIQIMDISKNILFRMKNVNVSKWKKCVWPISIVSFEWKVNFINWSKVVPDPEQLIKFLHLKAKAMICQIFQSWILSYNNLTLNLSAVAQMAEQASREWKVPGLNPTLDPMRHV